MRTPTFCNACYLAVTAMLSAFALASGTASIYADDRPNVVFVMTDQQFAEAMSCRMGKQYLHTPALDSLAENGVLFSRAYTANPLCMPARNSIFTGRYPHETRVTTNDNVTLDPAEFVSMGNYFGRAGYQTAYFGKWHLCFNQKDINVHGFETMAAKPKKQDHDAQVTAGAVEFIAKKHEKPFLLVASFLNPHNICEYARGQELPCGPVGDPPLLAECPPPPANLAPPLSEPDGMTLMRRSYHATSTFPVGGFTSDDWRRQRWGYYRMIEKVDAEIGKVLRALRSAGLEEKTLIVFTADHGECAGAHRFNQKTVLYEESVRVPLLVSFRGKTKQAVCDKLVNTGIDILPTLLDFAGITQPKKLPGLSLRPLTLGQAPGAWREYVVIENHMVQGGEVDGMKPELQGRMVRSERYKYCVYDRGTQRESLVDLQEDPGETKNLATDPNYRKILLAHRELLANSARQHHDAVAEQMLASDVEPRPFTPDASRPSKRKR